MNINSNELLLLKRIKFAGVNGENPGVNEPKEGLSESPEQPQVAMNRLMFQGLKNVVSDPQLAQEVGGLNEVAPQVNEEVGTEKEYVAPFKSNLAFQGKAGKFKTMVAAAMMGLATLGSVTTLSSCDKTEMNQSVEVDMAAIMSMISELTSILQDMQNQNAITNQQLQQMNAYMLQLLELVKSGNMSAEEFYEKMFNFMVINTANQEIIIDQLVQNGMKQDEANKLIQDLINQVASGQISAQEALDQIKSLLGDIKGLLQQAINDFNKFYEQMLAKQDELINTNKQGFDELIKRGDITNATLNDIKAQNDSLIVLNNKASEERQAIKDAIVQANIDSNANFETVVKTLNVNKNELINAMMKLGYTMAEIEKMTAAQIIKAIDNNTAVTKGTNMMLSIIANQLRILPELLKENKITNAQLQALRDQANAIMDEIKNGNMSAEEFYKKALNYMIGSTINQNVIIAQLVKNGKTEAEANKLLQQLIAEVKSGNKTAEAAFNEISSLLGDISDTLDDMNQTLKDLYSSFNSFYNDYKADKQEEMKLLKTLVRDNKLQTSVLFSMNGHIMNMDKNIKGIKADTDKLIEIAQDDTKHQELIEVLKQIQAGGVTNIDYQRLEEMFKLMNMNLQQAISMSSAQLVAAIKNFQNTYINVEQKQTEELQSIQIKLDALQMFLVNNNNKQDNQAVIDAINNLTNVLNGGNEDITDELKAISEKLDKLQATVDALLKTVANQASKVDVIFNQWNGKFDAILSSLNNIDSKLSTTIANQRVASATLNNLLIEVKNLKAEIQKLVDQAGGNISLEELEEMWQKHDESNYEKYSKLLKDLGLGQGGSADLKTIEDLLASIDAKMDNIKDNSDILTQILNKLNGIDFNSPEYSAKLDRIIELLENFKCNCNCGGNNEGILGDLDNILGA